MCFARSHALLTKHHPTLYSLDELNALVSEDEGENRPNGEAKEEGDAARTSRRFNGKGESASGRREISSCFDLSLQAGESALHQYLKQNMDAVSQLSTSVDFACESEFEVSGGSELSRQGLSVSSYDWVFRGSKTTTPSTASSETLIDENTSLSDGDTSPFWGVEELAAVTRRLSAAPAATAVAANPGVSPPAAVCGSSHLPPNSLKRRPRIGGVDFNSGGSTSSRPRTSHEGSSSESEYETAPCLETSGIGHSNSSPKSASEYTMCGDCSSSSSEDLVEIMKTFGKH